MSDVFVSYANEDRAWAEMLARALEGRGWSIFWDRTIPIGKTWRETIGRELSEARCVVVIWSKASIASGWVQEEADDAKRRGILVPVLIEGVEAPIGFRSLQAADLSDWKAPEPTQAFQRLINDISQLIASPSKMPDEAHAGKPPPPILPPVPILPARRSRWALAIAGAAIVVAGAFAYQFLGPQDSSNRNNSYDARHQNTAAKEPFGVTTAKEVAGATTAKEPPGMTTPKEPPGVTTPKEPLGATTAKLAPEVPPANETPPSRLDNYTLQYNQDIDKQDIVQPDGQAGIRDSEINACALQCDANPACVAFSFDRWNKMCFLKRKISTSVLEPRSAIGIKKPFALPTRSTLPVQLATVHNHRFDARPIATANVSDLTACQVACAGDRRCVAFSFLRGSGQAKNCQIFDNVQDAYIDDPLADSGWKEQAR
ncbi:TIR domain-containing protein [Bradyrhizobium sp. SZCCHNRI1009]|uniref:TIR domain-containing protein n=1 Tax=Bradyrhizobium sp. SZCCHNRI1009 TaxID=3057277 RepID=UPI002916517F|nr:TIR domain-containing protein [Bradyrhizobium sp. SZCCHNRI1009]